MHDEWDTIYLEPGQNVLLFMHTAGAGNAATDWYEYLISAGDGTDHTGNAYKIGGTIDAELNWNDGLSVGLHVDNTIWARVSILYL
jgi:hypothetical protein